MGKKRGKSSREEDEFLDLIVPSCRHIRKGTDQTIIKKVPDSCKWSSCQDCSKPEDDGEKADEEPMQEPDEEAEAVAVWMCLKCGHRGCGRHSKNKHAVKHFETPRSDPHCLVISLDQWSVWCYICDDEVQYSTTSHLAQLVTNLKKKVLASDPETQPQKKVKDEDVTLEVEPVRAEDSEELEDKENRGSLKKSSKKEKTGKQRAVPGEDCGGVPVKGLSNLGNTCFFNAVIQNLSQTQQLRETLSKVKEEKMSVTFKPPASSNLEPIEALLDDPGPLTMAMCKLLNEIQESSRSTVLPQELFSQVCKKAARFKGFQQQDSQELLRYLLDGMRAEEIKRANASLMEKLKEANKNEEELKELVKEYEKIGFQNFVDQVFGGETTSTIMCQQCKTVSVVTEMFLDLSLPVSDEVYRKSNLMKGGQKSSESHRLGSGDTLVNGTDDAPSGSGSKYQQKKAKKQAKKQAKSQKRQQKLEGKMILNASLDKESSALEEPEEDSTETSEENQKNLDSVEKEEEKEEQDESTVDGESPVSNRFTILSEEAVLSSANPEPDSDLVNEMEELKLDDAFIEPGTDSPEEESVETSEYTVVNQDPELAFQTLAPRPSPEKQECSVHSCLFQFTDVETLCHNNSLLCVTCTERQAGRNKAEGPKKNVYTEALKQMLISSPPPVLTLHLKRFQQIHYIISKVNRHVNFPLVLDLAPFCAVNCKNLSEGDTRVMYSLYGVVQHSGTMKRGHYTAYVKARAHSPEPPSAAGDAESPKGSWFHISDTSVQPVSESTVLGCQAYVLFYEKIF